MMSYLTQILSTNKIKGFKPQKVSKLALNSQLKTVQILTNNVQMLMFCLSYFITTVCVLKIIIKMTIVASTNTMKLWYPFLTICLMKWIEDFRDFAGLPFKIWVIISKLFKWKRSYMEKVIKYSSPPFQIWFIKT